MGETAFFAFCHIVPIITTITCMTNSGVASNGRHLSHNSIYLHLSTPIGDDRFSPSRRDLRTAREIRLCTNSSSSPTIPSVASSTFPIHRVSLHLAQPTLSSLPPCRSTFLPLHQHACRSRIPRRFPNEHSIPLVCPGPSLRALLFSTSCCLD